MRTVTVGKIFHASCYMLTSKAIFDLLTHLESWGFSPHHLLVF